jgi:hypothetical protein
MERSGEVNAPNGLDPIDRLRAADPIRADEVPDASLARVSARVQEHIVNDIRRKPILPPTRGPLAVIGGLAVAGALAFALAFGSGFGAQAPGGPPVAANPTPSEDPSGNPAAGGGMASCLMYDPANLPTFDIVFDGSVTAVDGDQVTFDVNEGWKGADGSITLTAPDTDIALLGPMPDFQVGGRYLVTAAGSNINACGYTLDYDAATAAAWAAAFGG